MNYKKNLILIFGFLNTFYLSAQIDSLHVSLWNDLDIFLNSTLSFDSLSTLNEYGYHKRSIPVAFSISFAEKLALTHSSEIVGTSEPEIINDYKVAMFKYETQIVFDTLHTETSTALKQPFYGFDGLLSYYKHQYEDLEIIKDGNLLKIKYRDTNLAMYNDSTSNWMFCLTKNCNKSLLKDIGTEKCASMRISFTPPEGYEKDSLAYQLNDWITCLEGNCRDGTGISIHVNGDRYEGQFDYSLYHGHGKYIYNNGEYYIGSFKNIMIHGNGKFYRANGDLMYEGEYYEGQKRGIGKEYYENGARYKGEYLKGKRNGLGIYYYPDGRKYIGEWSNNAKHGNGTIYTSTGEVEFAGIYQNDKQKK